MKRPITARFEASARVILPNDKQRREVIASFDRYRDLMPKGVDINSNKNLLFVAGEAFLANSINLNGHAVDGETARRIGPQFIQQPIDIEHEKERICGVLWNNDFGTYPNNERIAPNFDEMDDEQLRKQLGSPFFANVLGVVWESASPEFFAVLKESANPKSPLFGIASFSWELKAEEFQIIKGGQFLSECQIISNASEEEKLFKCLKSEGGSGKIGKDFVGALLSNPIVTGIGLVRNPAGRVKPVSLLIPTIELENGKTKNASQSYCSTQFTLSEKDASPILDFINGYIPDDEVYSEEGEHYGKELEPHITALYGIKNSDPHTIKNILADCGTVTATLGKISAFKHDKKPYDVLKIDVHGKDLHDINSSLKNNLEYHSDYPDYHPHLTLAYLKKGKVDAHITKNGDKFEGKKIKFDSLHFRDTERNNTELPLGIKNRMPEMAKADYNDGNDESKNIVCDNDKINKEREIGPAAPSQKLPLETETETSKSPQKTLSDLPESQSKELNPAENALFGPAAPDISKYLHKAKEIPTDNHNVNQKGIQDNKENKENQYKQNKTDNNTPLNTDHNKDFQGDNTVPNDEDKIYTNQKNTDKNTQGQGDLDCIAVKDDNSGNMPSVITVDKGYTKNVPVEPVKENIIEVKPSKVDKKSVINNTDKNINHIIPAKVIQYLTNNKYNHMKFENITELSASLKMAGVDPVAIEASTRFIEEELARRSEGFKTKIEAAEDKNKETETKLAALHEEVKKMEDKHKNTEAEYKKIKDKQDEMAKKDRFNSRMAELDADYEMDDADRAAIVSDVNDSDDDMFGKWKANKFAPLMRHKNKEALKAKMEKDKACMAAKEKEVEASNQGKEVQKMQDKDKDKAKKDDKEQLKDDNKKEASIVAAIISTAEVDKKENVIPNGPAEITKSLREKFAGALDMSKVDII